MSKELTVQNLSIDRYNELLKIESLFNSTVKYSEFIEIFPRGYFKIVSNDDVVIKLSEQLSKNQKYFYEENEDLKNKYRKQMKEIKSMSIWQFLKWRSE